MTKSTHLWVNQETRREAIKTLDVMIEGAVWDNVRRNVWRPMIPNLLWHVTVLLITREQLR